MLRLIERDQRPFAGRNILHVRPSVLTRDFMTAATTWDVTVELLNHMGFPAPKHLAGHGQVTPSMAQMQEAWGEDKLTAEEVGKVALYRLNMKAAPLGACLRIQWSRWRESDSSLWYEQGFSPLED